MKDVSEQAAALDAAIRQVQEAVDPLGVYATLGILPDDVEVVRAFGALRGIAPAVRQGADIDGKPIVIFAVDLPAKFPGLRVSVHSSRPLKASDLQQQEEAR